MAARQTSTSRLEITTMRTAPSTALLLSFAAAVACAQQPTDPTHGPRAAASKGLADAPAAAASMSREPDLKWGPAPAIFPAGAQMAVLQGDPGSTNLFTVRLRFPNGYRIAPHTHPTDEHVTVIEGTFLVGMGETASSKGLLKLKEGGFVTAPANHAHYAMAQGRTIVQVHAIGPFAMTYVNPADTPAAARK
jgi:quercetin dioxygenase-like cupin family protein